VAIVGLSTSRQTPWFTCYGRLGDAQLERLESILADERLAEKVRVVAIHHPPAGRRAAHKNRGLRDHADFAAVIERSGAELVLHGHEHEDLYEELAGPDGPVPVRGIQSGTYEAGKLALRARYRIYEIGAVSRGARPTVISEALRVWNPAEQTFEVDVEAGDLVAEPA
jgi:3',5'-cyclic AMP phosphodiesterase CpdA